ncbi:MAG: cytochrome c oxidase subunit I [Opitutales bacterium]|tara:strand:+ start:2188 stop:4212 length:2025 start_codon:yes stop_codon:yes gene_type:complete
MAVSTHAPVADKRLLPPSKSLIGLIRPDTSTGLVDWLTTVDHKKIGIMYGGFALFFFLLGGIEALLIRLQLMYPGGTVVSAQTYNQLFTMHGTTMVFLAVMPLNAAFFNFVMPLQIGARDVAFPRLNALGLWAFVAGALILNLSWLFQWAQVFGWFTPVSGQMDIVPAIGWFGYAPITGKNYSGIGTDFWIFGLQVLGVASLVGSFNFITTIINMRAPGMTMMRLPLFTWMTLITSFLIIFAFPAITIALVELMFDRFFGTNFYHVEMGGQPILWQHLFWIFGHPEVYILILPTMGIVSEILPTFARKPLFGYPMVVFSGAVIGFLGFAVWSHHMFTTGLGVVATAAFSLLTMAIAVPTGVKILNWIGTLWGGHIRFSVPMVFALGFIWMFMMGGFSGIMHSAAPADAQQQDSYFVVAHFHYVLIGGALLAILGGLYFWVPKIFGRMMSEKVGYIAASAIIIGFNVAFFPMHYLGLTGMPRRTHTYLAGFGWETWNFVATIGAFVLGIGVLMVIIDLIRTVASGKPCGSDPWDARTLEWSLPSPVPAYNFAHNPVIPGRDAWWLHKYGKKPEQEIEYEKTGPEGIHMPSQSWWPLVSSVGLLVVGVAMALHSAGVPYCGYVAIGGLGLSVVSFFLWALEGPGGYHLTPPDDGDEPQKVLASYTPEPSQKLELTH